MINSNHHPTEEPPAPKSLCAVLNTEHDRAWKHRKQGLDFRTLEKPFIEEFSMSKYMAECSVLPPKAKESINEDRLPDEEELPRSFEASFERGLTACIVALPFMDSGFNIDNLEPDRWEWFINENQHIKYLRVDPSSNNLTYGLGDVPIYIYDYLPELIKSDVDAGGCSFALDYPFQEGDFRNRYWFLDKCKKAINNLGKIIRGEEGDWMNEN